MTEPTWLVSSIPLLITRTSSTTRAEAKGKAEQLEEVDPTLEAFEKLGIPLSEQKRLSNVAVDAILIASL